MSLELLAKKAAWIQVIHPYAENGWGISVRVHDRRNEIAHLFSGDSLDKCVSQALQHCKTHVGVPLYPPEPARPSTGRTAASQTKPKLKIKKPTSAHVPPKKKLKVKR
jgi:hypothetical protein